MLNTGIVFDVKKFSIHDGPGIRTTVFFKGCPLCCRWCHNPESQAFWPELVFWEKRCIACGACVEACTHDAISHEKISLRSQPPSRGRRPEDGTQSRYTFLYDKENCVLCGACIEACYAGAREIVGQEMTVAQVMAEIDKDRPFYDESGGGVTFSGGEPLSQPEFLAALLRACREREMHTAVDTCGFAPWRVLDGIRDDVDLFLYDLKLLDEARHRQFTGVSNELILDNLRALSQLGHDILLRVPVIPGVNDDDAHVCQIGAFAASLPHLKRVDLLPYHHIAAEKYRRMHREYDLLDTSIPTGEQIAKIARILREFGLEIEIGG